VLLLPLLPLLPLLLLPLLLKPLLLPAVPLIRGRPTALVTITITTIIIFFC
jgi:hypothetical protein